MGRHTPFLGGWEGGKGFKCNGTLEGCRENAYTHHDLPLRNSDTPPKPTQPKGLGPLDGPWPPGHPGVFGQAPQGEPSAQADILALEGKREARGQASGASADLPDFPRSERAGLALPSRGGTPTS